MPRKKRFFRCEWCSKEGISGAPSPRFCNGGCAAKMRAAMRAQQTEKICVHCNRLLPITLFLRLTKRLPYYCRECVRTMSKEWRDQNKPKMSVQAIKEKLRLYNISMEYYLTLVARQGNKCAICGKSEEEEGKRLSIDHCHDEKYVRALLCRRCNTGIGLFKDNADLLERCVDYLRIHKEFHDFITKGGTLRP